MYTKHQPKLGVCSLVSLILGVSEIRTSSNYNNRLALGKVIKLGEIHTEKDALFKVPKFVKHNLLHCNSICSKFILHLNRNGISPSIRLLTFQFANVASTINWLLLLKAKWPD